MMASLMHDVAYYYGGSLEDKANADKVFGRQIVAFAGLLDSKAAGPAQRTAAVDVAAVTVGGGWPFREDYSWAYGFAEGNRQFTNLEPGEREKIQSVEGKTLQTVVKQIAAGQFTPSKQMQAKLDRLAPEYREQLLKSLQALAIELEKKLKGDGRKEIPGFDA